MAAPDDEVICDLLGAAHGLRSLTVLTPEVVGATSDATEPPIEFIAGLVRGGRGGVPRARRQRRCGRYGTGR